MFPTMQHKITQKQREGAKTTPVGRFYSFKTVGRGAAGFKRNGEVSPSADGDLRNFLKKVP